MNNKTKGVRVGMNKQVIVYITALTGDGCFKHTITVTDENFVSETPTTITIREWISEDVLFEENTYHKTIDSFIEFENLMFNMELKRLNEKHHHTLEFAYILKNEQKS